MRYPYVLIVFMVLTGLLVIPAMAGNDTVTSTDMSDRAAGKICTTPDGTADIVVTGIRNTSAPVDCNQVLAGWESIPAPLNTAPESAAGTRALLTSGVDDSYTKSLMHFNGNNGNTTFTDETGKVWNPSGSAQISTSQSKFGGASLSLDGSGDYLYGADSTDWDLGSNFTVDFWVRFNQDASTLLVGSNAMDSRYNFPGWNVYYDKANNLGLRFAYHDGSAWRIFTNTLWTPALNTWYHIAITRDTNGTIRHFINGQQVNSWVNTYPLTSGSQYLFIGGINGFSSSSLNGNIDEVRISKGIARWTASFTPPDHEYGPVVAPVANFTGMPLSGTAPLNVSFTDTSTNYPTNWTWLFGAGNNSVLQNPTHTYTTAGTYTVSHSATNAGGTNWTNRTAYITVTAPAPKVKFASNVSSGFAPLAVKFTDQSTGSPTRWNWSFGDGTWFNTSVAAQKSPVHTYTDPGNYTARLIACNAAGCNTTAPGKLITARFRAFPTARFTTNVTTGTAPLAVKFTDTSIGLSLNKWNWSFGDGTWFNTTVAAQKSPAHVYLSQGTYTSALTVSNASGSNMTVPGTVVGVTAPVARTFSITNMEIYYPDVKLSLAYPAPHYTYFPGTGIITNLSNRLQSDGWQQAFYHNDSSVTKADFGTTGEGLNAATFHYHFGHGNATHALQLYEYIVNCVYQPPPICLPRNFSPSIHPSEMQWNGNLKWIIIDACSALENRDWAQPMGTTHSVMGFVSEKIPSQDLPNLFLQHALDDDDSIYNAYRDATIGSFTENVTVAVIFSNNEQLQNDHFPGHGTVMPDENPNDHSNDIYEPWQCGGGPTEDKPYN